MKPEEAIKLLKEAICYTPYRYGEAFEMAIEALKKQIPMQPTEINEDHGYFECPACNEFITALDDFETHKFCLMCGQALKWSDSK